ncbi:MAG: Membrane protein, partial [uncultured Phycisphaerae bacterium]
DDDDDDARTLRDRIEGPPKARRDVLGGVGADRAPVAHAGDGRRVERRAGAAGGRGADEVRVPAGRARAAGGGRAGVGRAVPRAADGRPGGDPAHGLPRRRRQHARARRRALVHGGGLRRTGVARAVPPRRAGAGADATAVARV